MDFEKVKMSTGNHSAQTANNQYTQENTKNTKNINPKDTKEPLQAKEATQTKEVTQAKELYAAILSDNRKTSEEAKVDEKLPYSEKEIDRMLNAANAKLAPINKAFKYDIHDVTKRIMIRVVEAGTNNVIKEIPPEKAEDALANMWELAGLIVDEKR